MAQFRDRFEAGRVLAQALSKYSGRTDLAVLALPRGGVPVAFEVARHLHAPLDVFVVRKLGLPGYEEFAMGALASGEVLVLDRDVVARLEVSDDDVQAAIAREKRELARREQTYRRAGEPIDVSGKVAILVDDGLATGSTMRAAIRGLRQRAPSRIVAAVPIAAPSVCKQLTGEADEMVCAVVAEPLYAVGVWYEDFAETSDEEVRRLLEEREGERTAAKDG
jgi:predicted phosphoribosyltransferase